MTFLDERFWLAVSFVIFVYLAYRPVKKAILASLDNKIIKIQAEMNQAQALNSEARALLDQVEQDIAKLGALRTEMLDAAARSAYQLTKSLTDQSTIILQRQKTSAIAAINQQKLQANEHQQAQFIVTVTQLVTKYFQTVTGDDQVSQQLTKCLIDQPQSTKILSI